MFANQQTLVGGTAKKLLSSGVATRVSIITALTDCYLGGDSTVSATTGYGPLPTTPVTFECTGDLWAFSATGGAVKMMTTDG